MVVIVIGSAINAVWERVCIVEIVRGEVEVVRGEVEVVREEVEVVR